MHSNTGILAGALLLVPGLALGADLGVPMLKPPPMIEDFAGGWYLRGDIGFSSQQVDKVVFKDAANVVPQQANLSNGFDGAGIYKVGLGYKFNSWFRADVTGEYRTGSELRSLSRVYNPAMGVWIPENDSATKNEWVVMANAYLDLGTWAGLTPFVGVGLGAAKIELENVNDLSLLPTWISSPNSGVNVTTFGNSWLAYQNGINAHNYGKHGGDWNFAWAIHAGVAYRVTPAFTVELAYRYMDLGDAGPVMLTGYDGSRQGSLDLKNITSHDVTLGMRWQLGGGCYDCSAPPPPPLIRKY